jgi:coproporphyrinogen III oxidase
MENINLKKDLQTAMAKLEQLKIKEANYAKLIHEVDDHEREIIGLIKRGKYVTATELLQATTYFGMFDTEEETEAFLSSQRKRIKHALETLEYAGLVELTPRGWKWKATKTL